MRCSVFRCSGAQVVVAFLAIEVYAFSVWLLEFEFVFYYRTICNRQPAIITLPKRSLPAQLLRSYALPSDSEN